MNEKLNQSLKLAKTKIQEAREKLKERTVCPICNNKVEMESQLNNSFTLTYDKLNVSFDNNSFLKSSFVRNTKDPR